MKTMKSAKTGRGYAVARATIAVSVVAAFALGTGAASADDAPADPAASAPAADPAPAPEAPADAAAEAPSAPSAPANHADDAPKSEQSADAPADNGDHAADDSKPAADPAPATTRGSAPAAAAAVAVNPSSTIKIKVGSDRTASGATPLAGVKLGLWNGTSAGATGSQIADAWATCTSDGAGLCTFVVPDTGNNQANNKQFWVQQVDPAGTPGGYFPNLKIRTGSSGGSGDLVAYSFRTPKLAGGTTYESGNGGANNLMAASGGNTNTDTANNNSQSHTTDGASNGIWQVSRNNPTLSPKCGLSVALILDLSSSVGASGVAQLKQAADTFVDSLTGTPSKMSVFSFSKTSPADNGGNSATLSTVSTPGSAQTFKNIYKNWTAGGATNWDAALKKVADASAHYDVAVMITDGNPTVYGDGNSSTDNSVRDVENGIFSANLLKSEHTRVIAMGVGAGVDPASNAAANLAAISGKTLYDTTNSDTADYYQTKNYGDAGKALANLASGNCDGTLTVVKQVLPDDSDDIANASVAGGWTMSAAATNGVTLDSTSKDTDAVSGAVNFALTYPGQVSSTTITVTETGKPNYNNIPQDGINAVCYDLTSKEPIAAGNDGDAGSGSFTVDVPSNAAVSCTIYNQHTTPEVSLTAAKKWVVNNGDPVDNGDPSLKADGISADLMIDGTEKTWGSSYSYDEGTEVSLSESSHLPDYCTLDKVEANGEELDGSFNATLNDDTAVLFTNFITCEAPALAAPGKKQFVKDEATNTWVALPDTDAPVAFGDEVKYVIHIGTSSIPRVFTNTVVSDYVPGFDPDDATSYKGEYVAGSATCTSSDFTCEVNADTVTGLVTWKLTSNGEPAGDLRYDAVGDVEFSVKIVDPAEPIPFDENGNYTAIMNNIGYLSWLDANAISSDDAPDDVAPAARVAAAPVPEGYTTLTTNKVTAEAQLTEAETPIVTPPDGSSPTTAEVLPATGGPDRWLLSVGLGLLAAGAALVLTGRRRKTWS